ncbi:MAG: DUF192 domain-containing protein [bacterium]|nr:DUF192 domain-containing protein [bacterium]
MGLPARSALLIRIRVGVSRAASGVVAGLSLPLIFLSFGLLQSFASADARPREIVRISVDGNPLDVETARTPEDRERGLKYRPDLCGTCGMLFVFPREDRRAFYTQDVFIDLDIAYFGADGRLLEVRTLAANGGRDVPDENQPESDSDDAEADIGESRGPETFPAQQAFQYALAVNAGWFASKQIRRYARLKLPYDLPAL